MRILVCVKQVPGTSEVEVDPVTGVLIRDGVESKLNPYDLYSMELALSLRERYGGEVQALSMGPAQAKEALLETVYMGGDGGVLVSDRRFAGADVLATAYTLSQAIRRMGNFDLILCGKQTTDGDTAQVGAEIAEFLGIPHAANVQGVEIADGYAAVRVNMEQSVLLQRLPMPCLLCTEGEINTPRLPSYRRKKQTPDDAVSVSTLADFDDQDETHYGLTGSPTQVEKIFPPEKNQSKQMLSGDGEALAGQIADILRRGKFI